MEQQKKDPVEAHVDCWDDCEALMRELRCPATHLEQYLLPSLDPRVAAANKTSTPSPAGGRAARARGKPSARKKPKAKAKSEDVNQSDDEVELVLGGKAEKFEEEHLILFESAGLKWPPNFDSAFLKKTAAISTSPRMQQLIYFEQHAWGSAFDQPVGQVLTRDLNLSADWGATKRNMISCCTSGSIMWLWGRLSSGEVIDRKMTGDELLCVQGLPYQMQETAARGLSCECQADLAGNMFNGAAVLAFLTCVFTCMPFGEVIRQHKHDFPDADAPHVAASSGPSPSGSTVAEPAVAQDAGAAAEMCDSQMDGPPEASEDDDDSTLEELEDVDDSMWDDIKF
jgi:hypothetical protein